MFGSVLFFEVSKKQWYRNPPHRLDIIDQA
jgi:hypothetical protein